MKKTNTIVLRASYLILGSIIGMLIVTPIADANTKILTDAVKFVSAQAPPRVFYMTPDLPEQSVPTR